MHFHICFHPPTPVRNATPHSSLPSSADSAALARKASAPPSPLAGLSVSACVYFSARSILKNRIGGTHSTAVTAMTTAEAQCHRPHWGRRKAGGAKSGSAQRLQQDSTRLSMASWAWEGDSNTRHTQKAQPAGADMARTASAHTCSRRSRRGHRHRSPGHARHLIARRIQTCLARTTLPAFARACLNVREPQRQQHLEKQHRRHPLHSRDRHDGCCCRRPSRRHRRPRRRQDRAHGTRSPSSCRHGPLCKGASTCAATPTAGANSRDSSCSHLGRGCGGSRLTPLHLHMLGEGSIVWLRRRGPPRPGTARCLPAAPATAPTPATATTTLGASSNPVAHDPLPHRRPLTFCRRIPRCSARARRYPREEEDIDGNDAQ